MMLVFAVLPACEGTLDERGFTRRAERAYIEVHPGWTIVRRHEGQTTFVRGDQSDALNVAELFQRYQQSGQSPSAFFAQWTAAQRALAQKRRRSLAAAKDDVIPILKGGAWIRVQDLGAIGPARVRDKIRPWRQSVASDLFVVLGIPEERLGYRIVSIEEIEQSSTAPQAWVDTAVDNLVRKMGDIEGRDVASPKDDTKLLAFDLDNVDGVSGLLLSPPFRRRMLQKFNLSELGAAVPIRNVLIVFDPANFVTTKPIRARTHELYDTQNHPGFRGLLRFDKDVVSILEPANPANKGGT
ncbi:MAG: hypothetical protein AAFV29_16690 [Myxococcota bacterium]